MPAGRSVGVCGRLERSALMNNAEAAGRPRVRPGRFLPVCDGCCSGGGFWRRRQNRAADFIRHDGAEERLEKGRTRPEGQSRADRAATLNRLALQPGGDGGVAEASQRGAAL